MSNNRAAATATTTPAAADGNAMPGGGSGGSGGSSPVTTNHISRMGTPSSTRLYRSTSGEMVGVALTASAATAATQTASTSYSPSASSSSSPSVRFALPHIKTPLPPPPSNVANLVNFVSPSPIDYNTNASDGTNAQLHAPATNSHGSASTTTAPAAGANSPVKDLKNKEKVSG